MGVVVARDRAGDGRGRGDGDGDGDGDAHCIEVHPAVAGRPSVDTHMGPSQCAQCPANA